MISSATIRASLSPQSPTVRRRLAVLFVTGLLAVFFLTACGGDESALPPADSNASAGSAAASNSTGQTAAQQTTQSATSGQPATSTQSSTPAQPATSTQPAGGTTASTAGQSAEPVNVVAGNALLADLVMQVGGDRVSVNALVPAGADAHTWSSTPRTAFESPRPH